MARNEACGQVIVRADRGTDYHCDGRLRLVERNGVIGSVSREAVEYCDASRRTNEQSEFSSHPILPSWLVRTIFHKLYQRYINYSLPLAGVDPLIRSVEALVFAVRW
jgi:hypothetical protein